MLFANKGARERFGSHGQIRELSELYVLAEKRGLFTRMDSIRFVDDLMAVKYTMPDLKILRRRLWVQLIWVAFTDKQTESKK
jgi:hypothetical protein